MRRFRFNLAAATLLLSMGLSACLTGGGTPGFAPGSPSAAPTGTFTPSSSGDIVSGDAGSTSPAGSPAASAGGSDTMPPRADASDCMNYGMDGKIYCGPPMQEACRISFVPAPGIKVLPGTYGAPVPLSLGGKTTLNGRFYAETGSAPSTCVEASCWSWQEVDLGTYVRMRLSRNQPAAPQLQFYQDAAAELIGTDGGNVTISGVEVQTDDQVDFSYTFSEATPYGYSNSLVPLTDDVWSQYGVKCDMGSFKIETGVTTYRKLDSARPERVLEIPFK